MGFGGRGPGARGVLLFMSDAMCHIAINSPVGLVFEAFDVGFR